MTDSTSGSEAAQARQVALAFAAALDADDFDAAGALLDFECEYVLTTRRLRGRDAIVDSYRESSEWGRRVLDGLEYASSVSAAKEGEAVITFVDRLTAGDRLHEYRCRQRVFVDTQGRIVLIEHEPIAEEETALAAFFEHCGLRRR